MGPAHEAFAPPRPTPAWVERPPAGCARAAIALALRFDAPIFVEDAVMQKSKISDGEAEAVDTSEEGKKWADYLENLSPDDFGKYKVL